MDALGVHECFPWREEIMTDKTPRHERVEDELTEKGVKNRVSGAADQLSGKARNAFGAITGSAAQQVKGKAQELKGEGKDALGKAQMDAARAIEHRDERKRDR
jgi:uncharacterized protein YjbJ (UPF0337 family)